MKKVCSFLSLVLFSCGGPDYETKYYKAVSLDKHSTALLKIQTSKEAFYGDYQIIYSDSSKDDGSVRGHVKGDTLIGKFTYLSRDNVNSVEPIAFLKDREILKLGRAVAGSYLGLRVYKFGTITFGDTLLQFQPIGISEWNSEQKSAR